MKKSQMCFPLSMISMLCLIATGVVILLLMNANSWKKDDYYNIGGIAAAASAIFGIFSIIRGITEKKTSSPTLRSTGLLISTGCVLFGGFIAFNFLK